MRKAFVELMTDKWECDPWNWRRLHCPSRHQVNRAKCGVLGGLETLHRRGCYEDAESSSDQMWESLSVLRRTVHEMAKSTLVGLRLPTEEVKKITSSEGVKLVRRIALTS
ncbi:hypothetical protein ECG_06102 [Echinococcus granulosus]|nr:hypothetical protein ECG_06102 [Echinococcus granulosus]